MKGKFGAAELQFLTKAIDTAIAVGGKVIGAVERSQMDKGATGDAVAAAARSEGGMGGQKAMDAVSRAQAAADLGAGTLAPGPAAFAADQGASSAPTPVAAEEVVAVQEVGRPIVAMPGSAAPDREALLSRMEEARADFGSEWASSPPAPFSGPGTYAAAVEYPAPWTPGFFSVGLAPHPGPGTSAQAPQQAALADALGRAQALVHHANNTGDVRHLDPARKLYEGIIESGVLTDEQHAAVIDSEPFNAAFSAEWWGAPSPTAPVAAGPAPMAQAAPAPVAQQAAPQQQVMMSAEEALFRQRRQLDERERQRAAAFSPQSLRRMRPGQLRAVLRFAKTPQEAAAVMGAIRMAPEVQPMGLGDVLGGGHIARAQEVKGWKPPSVKAPPSEFEQTMKLQRHNAWLRESQARAKSSGALTDQRRAAIQADLDESAADAARRAKALKNRRPRDSAKEDAYSFYVANWAKHDRDEMTDADWESGAGSLASVGPAGLRRWAETNRLSRGTRKSAHKDSGRLIQMRKPRERAGVRTLLTASDIRLRENNIVKYEREEARARGNAKRLSTYLSRSDEALEETGHSRASIQAEIGKLLRDADIAAGAAQSNRDALGADQAAKSRGAATQPAGTVYTMDDIDALAEENQ